MNSDPHDVRSHGRDVGAHGRAPLPADQRNRRSIRLQGYDYSQAGAYFLTICTHDRECLFGEIVHGKMRLNDAGRIVADEWLKTEEIRNEIELDEWVVMPNQLHGIVVITSTVGAHGRAPLQSSNHHGLYRQPKSLGSLVAGYKSAVTKRINELRQTPRAKLWQRNYWEHIHNNPAQWELDKLFVGANRTAPTELREPVAEYGLETWMT